MKVVKPCPLCLQPRTDYERELNQISLLRCLNCGLVYANIPVDLIIEKNFNFADDQIHLYEEIQTLFDRIWFNIIANSLTLGRETGTVVDIGSGNGQLLRHFIDRGWEATGVDPSPWGAKFATKYGYELYASELETSGIPSEKFDVVTSTSTLEHIPNPRNHLLEIIRILKPGGTAFISGMPNYGSLSIRCNISTFSHNKPPHHVNYFTRKALRYLFNEPGIKFMLSQVRIRTYGVPELFSAYHMILKTKTLLSRSLRRNNAVLKSITRKNHLPPWKYLLGYLVTRSYYHLGRPFYLGDKLEVVIVKAK